MFGIDIKGTQAHSWVMSFPDELTAFRKFAQVYPDNCLLIVDTYDTLGSGIDHAITVFKELRAKGHKPVGIRLDSGDLAYLSKQARKMLDEAGFSDAIIFASGDLDEEIISSLNVQGAEIDVYGVGTKLITSENTPSLGGVYKLSQITSNGVIYPRMKISESLEKMTNPGMKKVYRLYTKDGKAAADYIMLLDEQLTVPLTIKHETHSWKKTILNDYTARELLQPVFLGGKCVFTPKDLKEIAKKTQDELELFWEELKRLSNPHIYKVDISDGLKKLKEKILKQETEIRVID
jgi:nicotinate phosphoribosyltransferase